MISIIRSGLFGLLCGLLGLSLFFSAACVFAQQPASPQKPNAATQSSTETKANGSQTTAATQNGGIYAVSRVLITPDYHGHDVFNASEIFGRGISQGVSAFYYPKEDRTVGALSVKFGYAIGRDALTNVFREFWPDIATHVLHRHP